MHVRILLNFHYISVRKLFILPSRHCNGKENAPKTAVFTEFEPWGSPKICRVRRNVVSLHRQTKKGGSPPDPSPRGEGSKMKQRQQQPLILILYMYYELHQSLNKSLPSPLGEGYGGLTPQGGFGGQSPEEAFEISAGPPLLSPSDCRKCPPGADVRM